MQRVEKMGLWERAYLPEILRGLMVTGYHFWRNLFVHILHQAGLAKNLEAAMTVQYPDERWPYPDTFRGRHRLTLKQDDTVQCTACFLCATACPAECIYIQAGEYPDKPVEKYPVRYEIDTLRCIYCGFCVEACPCDAIRMDTGLHPANWGFSRKEFVEDKALLMQRSRDLDAKGKEGLYEEHVRRYRHV
ncbi:MAG: NADH-quinone oxidoreductase subunit I [Deltaproteobacteria bacterium]|nr:NADH-quinone oxidoreductase subunit I [Deltaproteobacteria bacterium]